MESKTGKERNRSKLRWVKMVSVCEKSGRTADCGETVRLE